MAEGREDMMRWMTNGLVSPKNIRRNNPRFRFNYVDYCFAVQKAKAQTREINTKPEIHRMVYRHFVSSRLNRKSLCFLCVFSRLLHGVGN
ncbi:ORF5 [Sulfolobus spindle-shaped virus 3]|nr:ORF5 [Sulfolobus spindle-shaped virus 3]